MIQQAVCSWAPLFFQEEIYQNYKRGPGTQFCQIHEITKICVIE